MHFFNWSLPKCKHSRAFTVIEIVIALTILGILVFSAYVSSSNSRLEVRRTDAQIAVINTESAIEGYLARNNKANFTNDDLALSRFENYDVNSSIPIFSQKGFYRITIVPDSTGYRISATATVNGGLSDCNTSGNEHNHQCADTNCREISIDHGVKVSRNSAGVAANASTTTCW